MCHLGRVTKLLRLEQLGMRLREGWNIGIPLQQSGPPSGTALHVGVQFPNRIDHPTIVSIDAVCALVRVSGQMNLNYAIIGNPLQVQPGIEIVVAAGHIHIVDVEEQAAVGLFCHTAQEFLLGHRRVCERQIGGSIFQDQWPLQKILHDANPFDEEGEGFLVVGNRVQIVTVATRHAGPANMIAEPHRSHPLGQCLELA